MAEAGLSSLGVTFGYGVETTAGEKPATFNILTRINNIDAVELSPSNIDASALEDYETKYVPGRSEVTDTLAVTVNKTDATIAEWEAVIDAYYELTGGKRMWFEIISPGLTKAEFVVAAPPKKLPIPAKGQNELQTMTVNLTMQEFVGLDTKVDFT